MLTLTKRTHRRMLIAGLSRLQGPWSSLSKDWKSAAKQLWGVFKFKIEDNWSKVPCVGPLLLPSSKWHAVPVFGAPPWRLAFGNGPMPYSCTCGDRGAGVNFVFVAECWKMLEALEATLTPENTPSRRCSNLSGFLPCLVFSHVDGCDSGMMQKSKHPFVPSWPV